MLQPFDRCVVNSSPMPVDPVDGTAGEDGDAALLHLRAHMDADVLVEAAQDIVAAIDQRHIGAEAGKDAGKLSAI